MQTSEETPRTKTERAASPRARERGFHRERRLLALLLGTALCGCGAGGEGDSELNPGAGPDEESSALSVSTDGGADAIARARSPVVRELEEAVKGLLFLSESDYPLEVLYWTKRKTPPTAVAVAELTGHAGEPVQEVPLAQFFRGATAVQPGASAADVETAARYQRLVALLRRKLTNIRVFRFGTIQIHSYVVGVTSGGAWAGVATIQIET